MRIQREEGAHHAGNGTEQDKELVARLEPWECVEVRADALWRELATSAEHLHAKQAPHLKTGLRIE